MFHLLLSTIQKKINLNMFPTFQPNTLYFRICKKKIRSVVILWVKRLKFSDFFLLRHETRDGRRRLFSPYTYMFMCGWRRRLRCLPPAYIFYSCRGGWAASEGDTRFVRLWFYTIVYVCVCVWMDCAIMFPLCAHINIWSAREMDNTMGNTHTYTYSCYIY